MPQKIRNPKTGRLVKMNGRIGKRLLSQRGGASCKSDEIVEGKTMIKHKNGRSAGRVRVSNVVYMDSDMKNVGKEDAVMITFTMNAVDGGESRKYFAVYKGGKMGPLFHDSGNNSGIVNVCFKKDVKESGSTCVIS